MDLKYLLGQIQPDGGNLLHGTAPFHVVVATTTLWHTDAAIAGPSTHQRIRQASGTDEWFLVVHDRHADDIQADHRRLEDLAVTQW
jgi:hypothetical protein